MKFNYEFLSDKVNTVLNYCEICYWKNVYSAKVNSILLPFTMKLPSNNESFMGMFAMKSQPGLCQIVYINILSNNDLIVSYNKKRAGGVRIRGFNLEYFGISHRSRSKNLKLHVNCMQIKIFIRNNEA